MILGGLTYFSTGESSSIQQRLRPLFFKNVGVQGMEGRVSSFIQLPINATSMHLVNL